MTVTVMWGQYTSLALDSSGHPHISYYDFTKGDLKYAFWNGDVWENTTVDSEEYVGSYTSLALDTTGAPSHQLL
ncbi:BNR repeat-containing protein [Methanogenium cariaci]|uniref:BNR repeat-containing protein n=1 Tax=Methanogenium cariaci TaxID=2197 RepID=UPI001C48EE64|nr:BNR repeat-containing protein [Methanogenium cariaci]